MPETEQAVNHLHALGDMGSTCFPHAGDLFDHGLNLLVEQLGVDRALVASMTGRGLQNLWCAGAEGRVQDASLNFCPQVMLEPHATLVIDDADADPAWAAHSGWRILGVRAYLGAPLRFTDGPMGVLSVQSSAARAWQPAEVALVNAMAILFAKAMEVEALKVELAQAKEVLDLTAAVMEDHALESARTGLPTRRYLEVWCRSNLTLARRRQEIIAMAAWTQPAGPDRSQILLALASTLRGVDLLVDMGRDRFLLVLPRTLKAGAEIVLERFRHTLGPIAMGATLWNPMLAPDRDADTLQPAIRRAQAADRGGGREGDVVWSLLQPSRENILGEPGKW